MLGHGAAAGYHGVMSTRVRITDVSPRDGLQNEKAIISVPDKVRLVTMLCQTGVDEIEVTSFVSPKWVPQLGDATEVCTELARRLVPDLKMAPTTFSALVPNIQGLSALEQCDLRTVDAQITAGGYMPGPLINKVSVFTAASETFCKKNINASIAQSIERFAEMRQQGFGRPVRGYISCAIACPFEGPVSPYAVADVAAKLVDLGIQEIDLGDTIGAGTPECVAQLIEVVAQRVGTGWLERQAVTLHLHDTFGRAVECVRAALDVGVRSFDGAVGGLGGCPYASTPEKRAPGNINTLSLVRAVHAAGFTTGVDEGALIDAARFAMKIVGRSAEAAP